MKIQTEPKAAATVVSLEGDFVSEADQMALRDEVAVLVGRNEIHIVIDLAGVKYMNSCGLGSLVCALTKVRKAGGNLCLARVGDEVAKVIKLTKLDMILHVYPTVEGALSEVSVHAR